MSQLRRSSAELRAPLRRKRRAEKGSASSGATQSRSQGVVLGLLGLIISFGALLRFSGLAAQSFWLDEAFTREIVQGSLPSAWDLYRETESAPPLYYLFEWAWAHLFGTSDPTLRSLSALSGTLTIPVIFAAGNQLAGRRTGLIAAALTACSPLLVWYSQEARVYALYTLLSALSLWLFIRARDEQTVGSLLAWAIASALAIASHYLAGGLVAAESAWLLAGSRQSRKHGILAVTSVAVVTAALVPLALRQLQFQSWIPGIPLRQRVSELPTGALVGITDPATVVTAAALGLAGVGLTMLVVRGERAEKARAAMTASLVLLPVSAVIIAALLGLDEVDARNLLCVWPAAAVTLAIAFAAGKARPLGGVLAIALCGIGIGMIIEMKSDERLQRVDWRTAAKLIGPPRERVIALPAFLHRPLFSYIEKQGGRAWYVPSAPATRELDLLTYQTPDRGTACYSGLPCSMPDAGQTAFSAPPGFKLVQRRTGSLFVLARYRAPVRRPIKMHLSPFAHLVRETQGSSP
jgi:mannosyltransferase